MKIIYPKGATPLDLDEVSGLLPNYITTQGELNELEGQNIEKAMKWIWKRKDKEILNVSFILNLHKKMFGDVWKWAGQQRNSEKSIGVFKDQIIPK